MQAENQQELVARVRSGDADAFGQLVRTHYAAVSSYLAVRLNSPHDAEDLTQEVFLVALSRIDSLERSESLGAWLRGIARNLLRNSLRKKHPVMAGGSNELEDLIDSRISAREAERPAHRWLDALRRCKRLLTERGRRLIAWRYEECLSIAEICESLGCKHSRVTMMLHKIRIKLKLCIDQRLDKERIGES